MIYKCVECGESVNSDSCFGGKDMESRQLCFNCNFWLGKLPLTNRHVVIDGGLYFIGNEDKGEIFRGFGGRKFTIKRNNGEIIKTTNLWHNGKIPDRFKDKFPDNAEFMTE